MTTAEQVAVYLADMFTPPSLGNGAHDRIHIGMMDFNSAGDYVAVNPQQVADILAHAGYLVPDGTIL